MSTHRFMRRLHIESPSVSATALSGLCRATQAALRRYARFCCTACFLRRLARKTCSSQAARPRCQRRRTFSARRASQNSISNATAAKINVITYHNDTRRTGWNSGETALTPSVVSGSNFGLLHQVTLDDQVDAQPLLVTGLTIGGATHDVVYVATESNSVYRDRRVVGGDPSACQSGYARSYDSTARRVQQQWQQCRHQFDARHQCDVTDALRDCVCL